MSQVTFNTDITVKAGKTLKKEWIVDGDSVYTEYIALDRHGEVYLNKIGLDSSFGRLYGLGENAALNLGGPSSDIRQLKLHANPARLGLGYYGTDYGSAGEVLTSGGTDGNMSWEQAGASLSANNTFTGDNTFQENVTFDKTVTLESGATSKQNVVIKDASSNPKLTLSNDGRIGIGSSANYGQSGQVLTSGGLGELTWSAPSTSSHDHDGTYAELENSTTLTGYDYGTLGGSTVNFYPPAYFWGRVEFNSTIPGIKLGAVSGESAAATFSSGGISNTRFEVDNGNLVVKGTNETGSNNAVYSADYKNLSGQKIIVPSSTAFDPTEDQRTGTMKAIHNYIMTIMEAAANAAQVEADARQASADQAQAQADSTAAQAASAEGTPMYPMFAAMAANAAQNAELTKIQALAAHQAVVLMQAVQTAVSIPVT